MKTKILSVPTKAKLLTTNEVATLLNVHVNTVRRWARSALLKSYKIGSRGALRFDLGDVHALLKSHDDAQISVIE